MVIVRISVKAEVTRSPQRPGSNPHHTHPCRDVDIEAVIALRTDDSPAAIGITRNHVWFWPTMRRRGFFWEWLGWRVRRDLGGDTYASEDN